LKDLPATLSGQFDPYSRVARLYPALIALLPLLWTPPALNPAFLTFDLAHIVGASVLFGAGMTLLGSIARARGKAVQVKLLAMWGGWPTTIMLRHGDSAIDPHTKERYHARLQALCKGLTLPTPQEEAQDRQGADDKYLSATKRLQERRRTPEYKMLDKENALYGFRRNLLGLKPIALGAAAVAIAVSALVAVYGFTESGNTAAALFADAGARWHVYAFAALDLVYIVLFAAMVTPAYVRQAGDEYAVALLRTLEK
jgi:hypothetical protein